MEISEEKIKMYSRKTLFLTGYALGSISKNSIVVFKDVPLTDFCEDDVGEVTKLISRALEHYLKD